MATAIRDTHHRLNGHRKEVISPSEAFRWETEVVVLRGDNRADLAQRVQALIDYLQRTPAIELKDLAFTLNTSLVPGGSRLAIVAESAVDLQTRLDRAAERLADPRCRQIKDSRGSYYFDEPLHPRGKLAFLFPGEGGQYLNMLRDLFPHFPEVRAHFEQCDRLSLQGGRPEPISRAILLPQTATLDERQRAERELWRLDNAIASILIADWSIYQLLLNLGLRPDVIASHSAGEFSALTAAGCFEHNDTLIAELFALGRVLRQQEDDGTMAEFILLAASAPASAIADVLGPRQDAVRVAMSNCPHQTVLAGLPTAMALVEKELASRGIVCERLPFSRPYHTPLFEPFLAPVARMYETLGVRPPQTPIYSCITGRLFPNDPETIRRLSIEHWARPVEFTQMVENMYADGVRLFVECGPRGNLTSFVQDILRGQPCEAVAVNLAHRSGLTQINHLAALLAAHHVPLRFEHLYNRRGPKLIAGCGLAEAKAKPQAAPSSRAAIMQQYLGIMEQFLDLEREVMEQFLARRRTGATRPVAWPLLGEIIRHEPGRELVLRRRMDVNEDLYAADHTLGGRNASAIDPSQHGLPFMPMAFSLEMMAEAASYLRPGRLVVGMKRVRLQRWIPFDDEPITVELTARVRPEFPDEVAIEICDLGNAVRPGNSDSPAVIGTVLLDDHYPVPPPPEAFPLTREGPCRYTPHQLYDGERRLFHGPLFEALDSTDCQGDEGIEGHLRTLPHSGLFRSMPEPNLILDPLLIDASTHLLGCWHLGQPDPSGRVVLPYELGSVALYGPRPAVRTRLKCRVRIENASARQVSHRIDLLGSDDRLWCRLAPAEYWRFYWPLEYVDFFRHKERFLLARDWPVSQAHDGSVQCMRLDPPSDLCQPVHRAALARVALSRAEWEVFRLLKYPEQQLTDWLFGRIAAKDAIRALWFKRHDQRLFPADIELEANGDGRWTAHYRRDELAEKLPAVSFTSLAGTSAAAATFDRDVHLTLRKRDGELIPVISLGERRRT